MNNIYRIVVYEVDAALTAEGVSTTEIPTAQFTTEAMTPFDAAMQWGNRLEEEERS